MSIIKVLCGERRARHLGSFHHAFFGKAVYMLLGDTLLRFLQYFSHICDENFMGAMLAEVGQLNVSSDLDPV